MFSPNFLLSLGSVFLHRVENSSVSVFITGSHDCSEQMIALHCLRSFFHVLCARLLLLQVTQSWSDCVQYTNSCTHRVQNAFIVLDLQSDQH